MEGQETPKLDFFDLEGFVINLNQALEGPELEVIGEFFPDKPKKGNIQLAGKFVLSQPHEKPQLHRISYYCNPEGKIGYIYVETGHNASSDYGGGYERIILRLNRMDHDLRLKNGDLICKCGVELKKELEEGEYSDKDLDKVRTDYLLWGRFIPVGGPKAEKYLRTVMPSEWFTGGGEAPAYRSRMENYRSARARRGINDDDRIIVQK